MNLQTFQLLVDPASSGMGGRPWETGSNYHFTIGFGDHRSMVKFSVVDREACDRVLHDLKSKLLAGTHAHDTVKRRLNPNSERIPSHESHDYTPKRKHTINSTSHREQGSDTFSGMTMFSQPSTKRPAQESVFLWRVPHFTERLYFERGKHTRLLYVLRASRLLTPNSCTSERLGKHSTWRWRALFWDIWLGRRWKNAVGSQVYQDICQGLLTYLLVRCRHILQP